MHSSYDHTWKPVEGMDAEDGKGIGGGFMSFNDEPLDANVLSDLLVMTHGGPEGEREERGERGGDAFLTGTATPGSSGSSRESDRTRRNGGPTPGTQTAAQLIDLTLDESEDEGTAAVVARERKGKGPARPENRLVHADDDIIIEPSDFRPAAGTLRLSKPYNDDVSIVENPAHAFVCIGQIVGLALVITATDELLATPDTPRSERTFPVALSRLGPDDDGNETIYVRSSRSGQFAIVEHKLSNLLGPLLVNGEVPSPHFKGNVGSRTKLLLEARLHKTQDKEPFMVNLSLLLFARPTDLNAISNHFLAHRVILMNPALYVPEKHNGYFLHNPHADRLPPTPQGLSLPRYPTPVAPPPVGAPQILPGLSNRAGHVLGSLGNGLSSLGTGFGGFANGLVGLGSHGLSNLGRTSIAPAPHTGQASASTSNELRVNQYEQIFQNIKGGLDLEETEPPDIVGTPLYPHQKQALSFLLDREKTLTLDDLKKEEGDRSVNLWQPQFDMNCTPIKWRHLAIDMEIPGPDMAPQVRGAILADDMGLGKTLVVISLVAKTLEEAREWAKLPPSRDLCVGDERVKRSTATGRQSWLFRRNSPIWGASGELIGPEETHSLSKKDKKEWEKEYLRYKESVARYSYLVTRSRATLIVCPLSTIQNWESQFEEHIELGEGGATSMDNGTTSNGTSSEKKPTGNATSVFSLDKPTLNRDASGLTIRFPPTNKRKKLSIYIYHGSNRTNDPLALANHDVVITTYSTINIEFAKQRRAAHASEKRKKKHKGDSNTIVLDDSDDDGVGLSLDDYFKPSLTPQKNGGVSNPPSYSSPLQMVQWHRIVLDEAHVIKEHTTSQAEAVCYLTSERRICLTGTPVQNSLMDLYSLFKFLRVEPFSDRRIWSHYIGGKAPSEAGLQRLQVVMRHLTLRRNKNTKSRDGKPLLELPSNTQTRVDLTFTEKEREIYNSYHDRYKQHFEMLLQSDQVMRNYCHILQEILRLRQICVHPGLVQDVEDRRFRAIMEEIGELGITPQRARVLYAFMRDRMGSVYCSSCRLDLHVGDETLEDERGSKKSKGKRGAAGEAPGGADGASEETDSTFGCAVTSCTHLMCVCCLYKARKASSGGQTIECPSCDTTLDSRRDVAELDRADIANARFDMIEYMGLASGKKAAEKRDNEFESEMSTKSARLLTDLLAFSRANPHSANFVRDPELVGTTDGLAPVHGESVKSVVFSQWTAVLDRLGGPLTQNNIKYARLDGTMTRETRDRMIETFKSDPATEVFLISLKAGGVGLNLTAARRVYIFEPYWNPSVEAQAVDRIHRLGQRFPVQTIRYIMENSIEERMLDIQKRKLELARLTLTQTLSKEELRKRHLEDLKMMLS